MAVLKRTKNSKNKIFKIQRKLKICLKKQKKKEKYEKYDVI